MRFHYDPETDSLYISWAGRACLESEEIVDGVVLDVADDGMIVGIEIEWASRTIDLTSVELSGAPFERITLDDLPPGLPRPRSPNTS